MVARLKIARTPEPRSPERQALAEAKTSYDAAVEDERELEDALSSARETRWRSKAGFDKAYQDAKQAKTAKALRASREAHEDYQDEITAAEQREQEIKERREELATTLRLRQMRLESALAAAVATDPATDALFREFDAIKARFVDLIRAIEVLSGEMLPQHRRDAFFHGPGLSRRLNVTELLANSPELPSPLLAQWKAAIAALASDPDAPLPDV